MTEERISLPESLKSGQYILVQTVADGEFRKFKFIHRFHNARDGTYLVLEDHIGQVSVREDALVDWTHEATQVLVEEPVMSIPEFEAWLEEVIDTKFGGWNVLERSKQVTDGNTRLQAKDAGTSYKMAAKTLVKAQYGRARIPLVTQALQAVHIQPTDSFVDLGSGIGTVVLQVAATVGCVSSIGIELCVGRHELAVQLQDQFDQEMTRMERGDVSDTVLFSQGDFRQPVNFAHCRNADVLFVNNAESIFAMRSAKEGSYTLDWHVARLVCGMRVGSRVICFEALTDLETVHFKGCFTRTTHVSEPGATSWTSVSMSRTTFYVYTKIGDTWTCPRCKTVNTLLRQGEEEGIQDACRVCENDPTMNTKTYPMRIRKPMNEAR